MADSRSVTNARYYYKHPVRARLMKARARAKERGLPFDIEEADLLPAPTHCPILGIELKYTPGARSGNSASIDRIEPDKGYVKGNVLIVSDRANRAKNDLTLDELQQIIDFYRPLIK
jgi:hypothetical protein